MTINTWDTAQRIRATHLDSLASSPRRDKLLNAAVEAVWADVETFLAIHDDEIPDRTWWTCQLETGAICGRWSETMLEARLGIEIWWNAPVAWIVRDPSGSIHERYKSSVLVKHRYDSLFEVTPTPVEVPRSVNVPQRKPKQPTLFDLIGADS